MFNRLDLNNYIFDGPAISCSAIEFTFSCRCLWWTCSCSSSVCAFGTWIFDTRETGFLNSTPLSPRPSCSPLILSTLYGKLSVSSRGRSDGDNISVGEERDLQHWGVLTVNLFYYDLNTKTQSHSVTLKETLLVLEHVLFLISHVFPSSYRMFYLMSANCQWCLTSLSHPWHRDQANYLQIPGTVVLNKPHYKVSCTGSQTNTSWTNCFWFDLEWSACLNLIHPFHA